MSTKASTVQPPGRRTPLSLNASTKQINKPTNDNKNENNKKESNTNNQKTEIPKKDSQQEKPEKKLSTDKKQPSTETRKPSSSSSSSSSSDSKKPEEVKITRNEENKKNQNGVSTNGVKDKEKQSTNGGTIKLKSDSSSGVGSTPKKDSQNSTEKKKETTTEVVAKETKNEDDKNKVDEKNKDKEKVNADIKRKCEDVKKEKEKKADVKEVIEKKKIDEKSSEEKAAMVKTPEKKNEEEKTAKGLPEVIDLDSSSERSVNTTPVNEKKNEEMMISKTPVKAKNTGQTPKKEGKELQSTGEEDVDMMEPLTFEVEPSLQISAASTPAKSYSYMETSNRSSEGLSKTSPKSEAKPPTAPLTHTPDRKSCPRTFSSISGRRTIRPIGDYTFNGNLHIRESYRKINTELDFTTSSMNVTVGSEVPNNDSFSFFSRSRKRDRSSPTRQSAMEVQGDLSPKSPKRARIELGMTGFFSAMASPITMLRARLSRATVQSTPKKQVHAPIEDDIVQNVSGISVEEEITATEDLVVNPDSTVDNVATDDDPKCEEPVARPQKPAVEEVKCEADNKTKDTISTTDSQAKKKCSIM